MKEYFIIGKKGEKGSERLAELLKSDNDQETFLKISDNNQITLNMNQYFKREIPIEKHHLQKLGLIDTEGKATNKNNISVELIYFRKDYGKLNSYGDILIINRESVSPGYIIIDNPVSEKLEEKINSLKHKFTKDEISLKEASEELNGFYSLNQLFKVLKKNHSFEFNELDIIK